MKRKGFTLIELLAVIIVIGVVSLIIFPVVTKQISKSKQDLYNVQVNNIIKAAKDMVLDNPSLLDSYHISPTLISVEELQTTQNNDGIFYLEEGTIESPLDGKQMNGTVVITYNEDTSQYTYKYEEKSKAELSSLISTPAAQTIIGRNLILTNESESGLFLDVSANKYTFKGEKPDNFIKIGNSIWRILSIDKDKYTMKVAKVTHTTKVVWANAATSNYNFNNTALKIYTYLNSDFYNTLTDGIKQNIETNATFNIGEISGNYKAVKDVSIMEEKSLSVNANIGLITVGDYIEATYNLACRQDFTLPECTQSNYLMLRGTYFLMNKVKSQDKIWAVTDADLGGLTSVVPTSEALVIPTMVLKASAQITSGTGTLNDPYLLK